MPRLSPAHGARAGRRPRVSIVVPARDEERDVEAAVRSHLGQDYPDFEVVVVDDRSTDATPRILARLASEDPRLTVVAGVEPPPGWLGKPHALFEGAARARGELLLVADADVRYHPLALRESVDFLEGRGLDLVALFPEIEMRGFWENVLMPYLPAAYFFGPAFLINSDVQRRFAAGAGAGMLIRRSALDAAGGYAALRESVIDDIGLAIRIRRSGGRCRMVLARDRMRLRMYRGYREVVDGFTKNVAWVFEGWPGVFVAASTLVSCLAGFLPAAVLAAAALGVPFPKGDVVLAGTAFGLAVAARVALALLLRYPLWPAATQPLLSLVWAGITVRSLARRFLRREVVWRGRRYDASRARF